jgi:hypothetical protein
MAANQKPSFWQICRAQYRKNQANPWQRASQWLFPLVLLVGGAVWSRRASSLFTVVLGAVAVLWIAAAIVTGQIRRRKSSGIEGAADSASTTAVGPEPR